MGTFSVTSPTIVFRTIYFFRRKRSEPENFCFVIFISGCDHVWKLTRSDDTVLFLFHNRSEFPISTTRIKHQEINRFTSKAVYINVFEDCLQRWVNCYWCLPHKSSKLSKNVSHAYGVPNIIETWFSQYTEIKWENVIQVFLVPLQDRNF